MFFSISIKEQNSTQISTTALTVKLFSSIICSDNLKVPQSINCSNSTSIRIINAFYGRKDNHTCCYGASVNKYGIKVCLNNISCYSNQTILLKSICDYNHICKINITFVEPCYGTYKYLEINWLCLIESNDW